MSVASATCNFLGIYECMKIDVVGGTSKAAVLVQYQRTDAFLNTSRSTSMWTLVPDSPLTSDAIRWTSEGVARARFFGGRADLATVQRTRDMTARTRLVTGALSGRASLGTSLPISPLLFATVLRAWVLVAGTDGLEFGTAGAWEDLTEVVVQAV